MTAVIDILLSGWEYIVAGVLALVALFYRQRAKVAETQAVTAERSAKTHERMRDHEREAMQMDDQSLADRLTRGR